MLKSYYQRKILNEAGCDEAGRGCLAGPVVAAAVILPVDYKNDILRDSKKLTKNQRNTLQLEIKKIAISWAIGVSIPEEIDEMNILNATYLAFHRAISYLQIQPGFLLIDGNRFKPYLEIPNACIIGGDDLYLSIAAASVLAKTFRDDLMEELSLSHENYSWKTNKGYGTLAHRLAVQKFGTTVHHRKTFKGAI